MTQNTPEGLPPLPALTNERIDNLAELTVKGMPDGISGFLKTWGWQQFAKALLSNFNETMQAYAREALRAQAASAVPVGEWVVSPLGNYPQLIWERGFVATIGTKLYTGAPPAHVPADVEACHGLTAEQVGLLFTFSMKPEDITGSEHARQQRVRELLHWFARLAKGNANPKWLREHAFELALYIAKMDQNGPIDVGAIRQAGFLEGVNISAGDRRLLEKLGTIKPQHPTPEPAQAVDATWPTDAQVDAAIEAYDKAWVRVDMGRHNKETAIRAALQAARQPQAQQGGGERIVQIGDDLRSCIDICRNNAQSGSADERQAWQGMANRLGDVMRREQ